MYNRNNDYGSISFKNKIIVFEDIDCMIDIVKKRKNNDIKLNSKDKEESISKNKLLKKLIKKLKDDNINSDDSDDIDIISEIDSFISSEENIIDVSKKFSAYNIEQLINVILFTIINFQKSDILKIKTRFYEDNNNFLKNYDTNKLFFIYDKLVNIKKNINIIQNNETILFSICILFKKTAKSN